MKIIYLLFFILPLNIIAQNTEVDSVIIRNCLYVSDGDSSYGSTVDSVAYIYDVSGRIIIHSAFNYASGTPQIFLDGNKDSLVYDTASFTMTTYSFNYNTPSSYSLYHNVITYDNTGREIMVIYYDINQQPQSQNTFFYTGNNLTDHYFTNTFQNGVAVDSQLVDYTYDIRGNRIREEDFLWRIGSIFRPYTEELFYYDTLNNLLGFNNYLWIDSTVGFDPCYTDTAHFTYTTNNLLSSGQYWFCGGGGSAEYFFYDSNGHLDSISYSGYGSMGDMHMSQCTEGNSSIITSVKSFVDPASFSLYPNPAHDEIIIQTELSAKRNPMIEISDIAGRTIYSEKINRNELKQRIDVSSLHAGIYFLSFRDLDGDQVTKKFIIQ